MILRLSEILDCWAWVRKTFEFLSAGHVEDGHAQF